MRKGSVVTPNRKLNRTTIGQEYRIIRTASYGCFIIIDDFGLERMCYDCDFDLVQPKLSRIISDFLSQITSSEKKFYENAINKLKS